MASIVIDLTLQGENIIKELSFMALDGDSSFILEHYVFKPPSNEGSYNCYRSRINRQHIHGLSWDSGDLNYELVPEILSKAVKNVKFVFTKGHEKCVILKRILPDKKHVLDLLQFGCPRISILLVSTEFGWPCSYHREAGSSYRNTCSMLKTRALASWLQDNEAQVNLFDTNPRLSTFNGVKMTVDPLTLARRGFFRNTFQKNSICCVFCEKSLLTSNYCEHDCMNWNGC